MGSFVRSYSTPTWLQSRVGGAGYTRDGVLVLRAYKGDLDQHALDVLAHGGTERRHADYLDAPYTMPELFLRERERVLDSWCIDKVETHNVACNAGRTLILNYIGNNIASGNIATFPGANVFAVGNGNVTTTAPSSADTQLVAEQFRKAMSSGGTYNSGVSGNNVLTFAVFLTTEGNLTYTEAGAFSCTGTLPGSANTGNIFGHATYVYTKTNAISLTNDYFFYMN